MTKATMPLADLIAKHDDGDFLPALVDLRASSFSTTLTDATIAIDLQRFLEASEEFLGIGPASPRRIEVDDAGRIVATPSAIIAGQCPEVAGFRAALAGVEHRRSRLVYCLAGHSDRPPRNDWR